ncbi:MAG TPA: aminotransferase class V-fold PLP-dependent enzyme [Bacteroidia bacterium]
MQNTFKQHFLLNPEITYLGFGSFGSCAKPIFEDYQDWQRELEFEPVQFMTVNGYEYLKRSREALGKYIHCNADDIVYTMNPSYAINTVIKSMKLNADDEILTTNLEYGALDKAWNYYCKKSGAVYKRQTISLPLVSKEKFIEEFFAGLTSKTKAIFISEITSSTALRLPVYEICEIAKQKGLLTIVDGAHSPGHIPIDLLKLKADVYTGACHKWMLTPKGCSFLYIKRELQHLFDPLIISWGYESAAPSHSQFLDWHQLQGTRDFSAFLTVPKAIEFLNEHNWWQVAANCRKLVQDNALRFAELLGTQPLCPLTDEFLGQMLSLPIKTSEPEKLQRYLFEKYKIEVPVMRHEQHMFIRFSVQAYNNKEDLDKLYEALKEIKSEGIFIKN